MSKGGKKNYMYHNFVLKNVKHLCYRFSNFNCPMLKGVSCLDPDNALSFTFRETNNFNAFSRTFKKLLKQEELKLINQQWDRLPSFKIALNNNNITTFWMNVKNFHDNNGNKIFSEIGSAALVAITIPHANATPERKFSDVKNIKTDKRNCLSVETLDGIVKAREIVKEYGGVNFEPPEEMIDLFYERQYEKKKQTMSDSPSFLGRLLGGMAHYSYTGINLQCKNVKKTESICVTAQKSQFRSFSVIIFLLLSFFINLCQ